MADVVSVGEVLVDFVPMGKGESYAPRPGGAPANVAASLASLGRPVALVSAVGEDWLGDAILRALAASGIDTSCVQRDSTRATGIAVVAPDGAAGPDFLLHRGGSADASFSLTNEALARVKGAFILHVSSLLVASRPGEGVYHQLLFAIDRSKALLSYDVNLRESAWPDQETMHASALRLIGDADIVKVTEQELRELGLDIHSSTAGEKLWLVTDGGSGARLVSSAFSTAQTVPPTRVVDSTGAGDASLATLLDEVLASGGFEWTAADASRVLERVVRVGTHVVQQSGAMCDLSEFSRHAQDSVAPQGPSKTAKSCE